MARQQSLSKSCNTKETAAWEDRSVPRPQRANANILKEGKYQQMRQTPNDAIGIQLPQYQVAAVSSHALTITWALGIMLVWKALAAWKKWKRHFPLSTGWGFWAIFTVAPLCSICYFHTFFSYRTVLPLFTCHSGVYCLICHCWGSGEQEV